MNAVRKDLLGRWSKVIVCCRVRSYRSVLSLLAGLGLRSSELLRELEVLSGDGGRGELRMGGEGGIGEGSFHR